MAPFAAPPAPAPSLPRAVQRRVRELLPDARLREAEWIGAGWGAMAFRIPAPDGDWTLRLPRQGVPWAVADLERECRFLPLLATRQFEVAVPREPRLVTDDAGCTVGALHRLVHGSPLSETGAGRGAQRTRLLHAVGRFLAALHATPQAAARLHGVVERDLWTEVYLPRLEETRPLLGAATGRWLDRRIARFEEGGGTRVPRPAVIHGDISGHHLLLDEQGELAGVIDFAEARLSDPALDLAGVLNHLSWRDLERALQAYGAVDDATLERVRFYIDVAPIFSVTDGFIALGGAERRRGLRQLTARARAATRN